MDEKDQKLQDRIDAFSEKYLFEECDSEDYEKERTHQIEFTYPKKLRDSMSGDSMCFEYDEENQKLICLNPDCGLIYPIRDGIPIMLIDEAEKPEKQLSLIN